MRATSRAKIVEGKLVDASNVIVAANNHYAGFGPGTVNIFRQLIGLEEVKWEDEFIRTEDLDAKVDVGSKKRVTRTKQTSLSDFLK